MKNSWVLFLLLISSWASAQHVIITSNAERPFEVSSNFTFDFPKNHFQYLSKYWTKGDLFYTNGTSKQYDSLNFDRYANRLEVVVNNKALSLLAMGLAGALVYESSDKGTLLIVGKIRETSKFLLVNSNGKFVLANYTSTNDIEETATFQVNEIRFSPKPKPELIATSHYVLYKNGEWVDFKLSKSSISKLFRIDKKQMQSSAREAGIANYDDQGLIKLFQLLNAQ